MDNEMNKGRAVQELAITEEDVKQASERLEKYKSGKVTIDNKATENQQWWRLRHWDQMGRGNSSANEDDKPASAWLFNSIVNKHADIMDNFPKLNVLPRESDDIEEAKMLSKMIPVIHERNDEEGTYSQAGYDLIIEGGAVTGVFWDSSANDGMGEIVKKNVDVHNIFWEPGVTRIQESKDLFHVALQDVDSLKAMYPEHADSFSALDSGTVVKYEHDDNIDTSDKCEVVDWYYKKTVMVPAYVNEEGVVELEIPKQILHYCKFVGSTILYASENDERYRDVGFYNHGLYPFVIRRLFPVKDTPWGFGYVDVMKSPQKYIDALDQLILKNCMMTTEPRWWVNESLDFNVNDFADWSKPFVKVSGSSELDKNIKQMEVGTMPAYVYNHQQTKIEELKETSGNRDFSQGSTAQGVTAASAIAALQEAGGKLARDVNKIMYRGAREEGFMEVELIRQFYTEPRSFRVQDRNGGYTFETYMANADERQNKTAVFDISISAEKQSPFSRAAQNETAKEMYNMGMFNPQMAEMSLACLDMMEFEGKEQVRENIQNNSQMMQQLQQMAQAITAVDSMYPQLGLAQMAGLASEQPQAQQSAPARSGDESGTAEERAARKETDTTKTANARQRAAKQASIS